MPKNRLHPGFAAVACAHAKHGHDAVHRQREVDFAARQVQGRQVVRHAVLHVGAPQQVKVRDVLRAQDDAVVIQKRSERVGRRARAPAVLHHGLRQAPVGRFRVFLGHLAVQLGDFVQQRRQLFSQALHELRVCVGNRLSKHRLRQAARDLA